MKLKKGKFLVLTLIMFFILGSITILSNNKVEDKGKLVIEGDNSNLLKENYKSNLIVESDDNNIVTTEEAEEDGSIRTMPDNNVGGINFLPTPDINEVVILKKL